MPEKPLRVRLDRGVVRKIDRLATRLILSRNQLIERILKTTIELLFDIEVRPDLVRLFRSGDSQTNDAAVVHLSLKEDLWESLGLLKDRWDLEGRNKVVELLLQRMAEVLSKEKNRPLLLEVEAQRQYSEPDTEILMERLAEAIREMYMTPKERCGNCRGCSEATPERCRAARTCLTCRPIWESGEWSTN